MKTILLDSLNEDYNSAVNKAAQILKNGGIVAIPTETVYGLAASAYNENAINKVFVAKGRPQDNPLIVHISSMEMFEEVVKFVPQKAKILAEKFWPGPLTMICPKGDKTAANVSAGLDTVAVRFPSEKTATDIISAANLPLAAPSANISGKPSPTKAEHVINDLSGKIDAVVIGKECTVGVESTVVSLVGETPKLLRPGAITFEQLKELLPDITVDKAVLKEPEKNQKVASPGMKYKHYAPKTETYLVEGNIDSFSEFVNSTKNSAAVCFIEESDKILIPKIEYGSISNESTLAQNLFNVLRKVDELNVDKVYVHAPSKTGVGLAVYNRLIRAAAFRVIEL